jgi:hypothetical protein
MVCAYVLLLMAIYWYTKKDREKDRKRKSEQGTKERSTET